MELCLGYSAGHCQWILVWINETIEYLVCASDFKELGNIENFPRTNARNKQNIVT